MIPAVVSSILSVVSGQKSNARLSILTYHRVLPVFDPLRPSEVTETEFLWQMELIARYFNTFTLSDAVDRLQNGTLPPRSVCVTFDDGYLDNYEIALPILRGVGVPATLFVATGFLDGGRMWNDTVIESLRIVGKGMLDLSAHNLGTYPISSLETRHTAVQKLLNMVKYLPPDERKSVIAGLITRVDGKLPDDLMMSSRQVRELHQLGMEIGAHTVTHPILKNITLEESEKEIESGRLQLEEIVGQKIKVFAYPNGRPERDYRLKDVEIVRKLGFEAAVSTVWGVSSAATDKWQLHRFTPWDKTPSRFLLRLMSNYRHRKL